MQAQREAHWVARSYIRNVEGEFREEDQPAKRSSASVATGSAVGVGFGFGFGLDWFEGRVGTKTVVPALGGFPFLAKRHPERSVT